MRKLKSENPSPQGKEGGRSETQIHFGFQQKLMLSMMSHYLFLMSCVGEAEFQRQAGALQVKRKGWGKDRGRWVVAESRCRYRGSQGLEPAGN